VGEKNKAGHLLRDIGPADAEPDFVPGVLGDPEEIMDRHFAGLGRDYGGPFAGRAPDPAAGAGDRMGVPGSPGREVA
jgi:hypothetical protein